MKLTIIPDDKTVLINGERFEVDCAALVAQGIHAVQWYGSRGHIEFKDADDGSKPENEQIESIERFEPVIQAWRDAKAATAQEDVPEPDTLEQAQHKALRAVNARFALELAAVRANCPADEVQSWARQEAEARAYAADSATSTPLLSAMSAARGVELGELAAKVIAKSDQYVQASGRIIGIRQACEAAIAAAQTPEAASAVVWPEPVLPAAQAGG